MHAGKILRVPQTSYIATKVKCRDWRIEVGKKNINLGDDQNDCFRYYGALTMMASTLAYEHPSLIQDVVNNCWKVKYINIIWCLPPCICLQSY